MKTIIFSLSFLFAAASLAQEIGTTKKSATGTLKFNGQELEFNYQGNSATLGTMTCQLAAPLTAMTFGACGTLPFGHEVRSANNPEGTDKAWAPQWIFSMMLMDEMPSPNSKPPPAIPKTVRQEVTEGFAEGDVVQIDKLQLKKENCADDANALFAMIDTSKVNPEATPEQMAQNTHVFCAKLEITE